MSHRIGECSACGAVFKLPASFAHDQARCTKCGGVVNIAPAGSEAPRPVPAKKVAQKAPPAQAAAKAAPPAPKPAAKSAPDRERSGPSMKEKILARKQAEAAAQAKAAVAKPAPKAAAPARAGARPAVKSAAKPAARSSSTAGARAAAKSPAGAAGRSKAAGPSARSKAAGQAKPERASARAGGERTRPSARGTRARKGQEVDQGEVNYRDRVHAQRKKSSMLAGTVAVVLLGIVGGGAWWYVNQDPDPANAGSSGTGGVATAGSELEEPGTSGDQLAEGGGDGAEAGMDAGSGDEPTDAPTDEAMTDETAGADVEPTEEPAAAPPKTPKGERTAADVDLASIADFDKLPETTDEEWDAIRQDVADGFDLDAGASAGRARGRLEALGKPAFPAILNAFKQVDVSTETGHRVGDLFQKTLERICNGTNFGWKYPGEPEQFYFNAAVIRGWCTAWDAAKDDEAKWLKLSKQTASAEEAPEEPPKDDSGLDAGDFDFDD